MNGTRGALADPPALVSGMAEEFLRAAEVAKGQHGAVTARQFGDAGVSSGQRRRQVERGVLERSGAHTYRSSFAPRSARADLAAVVLDCGPDCVASGPTAAALHGFDGIGLRPPYHVTVLRGRNVQRTHHFVHTTTVLPRSDVARFVSAKTLTAMLDSALRDGLTSEEALHRRIVELRSSGRPGWRSCSP